MNGTTLAYVQHDHLPLPVAYRMIFIMVKDNAKALVLMILMHPCRLIPLTRVRTADPERRRAGLGQARQFDCACIQAFARPFRRRRTPPGVGAAAGAGGSDRGGG